VKTLALILFLTCPAYSQWREVYVSSTTDTRAIQENFRRASLWSSKKLDKSGGTITGPVLFRSSVTINGAVSLPTPVIVRAGAISAEPIAVSTIIFTTEFKDTHAAYDNTTGVFTCPNNSDYLVSAIVYHAATETGWVGLNIDGVEKFRLISGAAGHTYNSASFICSMGAKVALVNNVDTIDTGGTGSLPTLYQMSIMEIR